jgi:hypothetical protein
MPFHAPNSPTVAKRSPQHGICITGTPSDAQKTGFLNPILVHCIEPRCPYMVKVVPFGYHEGEEVNVKIACKKCYRPEYVEPKEVRVVGEGDEYGFVGSSVVEDAGGFVETNGFDEGSEFKGDSGGDGPFMW